MRVLILGLGQYAKGSGVSAALYFAKRGDDVTVADFYYSKAMDANVARLKKFSNVKFILGKHATQEVRRADLIVRHQRLRHDEPELVLARKLGKPLESELTIFLKECPATVIGITGTRGKSTTTALIAEMLSALRITNYALRPRKVWLGGNILVSPLTFLSKIKKDDVVVLEMSSFQLEGLGERGVSPPVAVITNLMRDHLNAYPSMKAYAQAKAQIFLHQKKDDVVFLPADRSFDAWAKKAPGKVVRVPDGGKPPSKLKRFDAPLSGGGRTSEPLTRGRGFRLIGEHNRRNAEFAVAVALHLGVTPSAIKKVLRTFNGLPNRLETVAVKKGVTYINDTTSTTPDATIAALKAVMRNAQCVMRKLKSTSKSSITHYSLPITPKIHLIFGGADKRLKFDDVAREIKRHRVSVTLLPGTAHAKIVKAFHVARVEYANVKNLHEAMTVITSRVKRGDVVLLSPGCASFGLFKNEFERGEKFQKLVDVLR